MINRDIFFDNVRRPIFGGTIIEPQVEGTEAILDAWDKWVPGADLRWIACSLGTAFHETAFTMQPVREIGRGRGHGYGVPTGPWHNVYYGRGDVQLTWERNYVEATHRLKMLNVLGPDEDLDRSPDLALQPDIAAAILIFGMRDGWFTGKKLADYFNDSKTDFVGSRAIINGSDQAARIARYCEAFHLALMG